jgi:hypothetical protein
VAVCAKGSVGWGDIAKWGLYPTVYLFYALIRGALFGLYPYPFIDVGQLGYARVFLNAGGMLIAFIGISTVLVTLDRAKRGLMPGQGARRIR